MSNPTALRVSLGAIVLLLLAGCDNFPKGYCTGLVQAYEECRADGDCWSRRHQWGSVSYMNELNTCYGRVARGLP